MSNRRPEVKYGMSGQTNYLVIYTYIHQWPDPFTNPMGLTGWPNYPDYLNNLDYLRIR